MSNCPCDFALDSNDDGNCILISDCVCIHQFLLVVFGPNMFACFMIVGEFVAQEEIRICAVVCRVLPSMHKIVVLRVPSPWLRAFV